MESEIRTNIQSKSWPIDIQNKSVAAEAKLIKADQEFVDPLIHFFNERFVWLAGEYQLDINVFSDQLVATKRFRFTIFESQSKELSDLTKQYIFGSGIYWDRPGISTTMSIPIRERDA